METLDTRRLILRPVAHGDLEAFVEFYGDPDVMSIRKLGTLDRPAALQAVAELQDHWQRHGFGMWSVLHRARLAFAGECGLRWLDEGHEIELSYGLYPRFRGQGLATEAARAALDHGFRALGLERIVALSRGDNTASHRVLEKLGMTLLWRRATGKHGLVKYAIESAAHGRGR